MTVDQLLQRVSELEQRARGLKGRKGYAVALHRLQNAKEALIIASNAEARKHNGEQGDIQAGSNGPAQEKHRGRTGIFARLYRTLAG